jgi:hypothetical protein
MDKPQMKPVEKTDEDVSGALLIQEVKMEVLL